MSNASSTSSPSGSEADLPLPSRIAVGEVPDEAPPSSGKSGIPAALATSAHRLAEGRMPCARKSYLLGIGTGVGVTAIRMVTGKSFRPSANWGAGAFLLVSVSSWEMCRRSLAAEQLRMKTIVQQHRRNRKQKASASSDASPSPSTSTSSPSPDTPPPATQQSTRI